MLFNSNEFILFFPLVFLVYFLVPKKARTIVLLIASYVFYMGWNAKYALLIAFSTLITYCSGLLINRFETKKTSLLSSENEEQSTLTDDLTKVLNNFQRKKKIVMFACIFDFSCCWTCLMLWLQHMGRLQNYWTSASWLLWFHQ